VALWAVERPVAVPTPSEPGRTKGHAQAGARPCPAARAAHDCCSHALAGPVSGHMGSPSWTQPATRSGTFERRPTLPRPQGTRCRESAQLREELQAHRLGRCRGSSPAAGARARGASQALHGRSTDPAQQPAARSAPTVAQTQLASCPEQAISFLIKYERCLPDMSRFDGALWCRGLATPTRGPHNNVSSSAAPDLQAGIGYRRLGA